MVDMRSETPSMRIIIAAEPIEDGAGLAMFLLDAVALFALTRPDWHFTVLTLSAFSDSKELEKRTNVKVIYCDRLGWRGALSRLLPTFRGRERIFNLLAEKASSRFIKRQFGNLELIWEGLGQYDAVWVPHFAISQNRWPAFYKPGTIKAPVLLTIHDLHPAAFPEEWRDKPQMLDDFWYAFRPFAQKAEAIITHSNFQKEAIARYFSIPPQKISVAYLPLPMNELLTRDYSQQEVQATVDDFGIARPYVFCPMSQTMEHKNHLRAIEAWAIAANQLKDKLPQLVFTANGHPEDQVRFKEEIKKRGLTGKVIFTGTVSRKLLAVLYRNCQAVLSPTLYEGGGSGPVIEAVVAGRPVICSRIPPIEEQMGRFGLSVNYFDPYKPADIARALFDVVSDKKSEPQNNLDAIRQRLPKDRKKLADTYINALAQISQKTNKQD
jgi:glycosyltransferase involved in cell wall biosynthesis